MIPEMRSGVIQVPWTTLQSQEAVTVLQTWKPGHSAHTHTLTCAIHQTHVTTHGHNYTPLPSTRGSRTPALGLWEPIPHPRTWLLISKLFLGEEHSPKNASHTQRLAEPLAWQDLEPALVPEMGLELQEGHPQACLCMCPSRPRTILEPSREAQARSSAEPLL